MGETLRVGPEALAPRPEIEPKSIGIGILCPGQGSQIPGMGRVLHQISPAAQEIFRIADEHLGNRFGFPLSQICFDEELGAELRRTDVAQAAIGVVSVAALEAAKERMRKRGYELNPLIGAGISFGELPNLVAAGVISLQTFLDLILKRGEIMEDVGKRQNGAMRSVLGVTNRDTIERICTESGVFPGIWYPGVSVISGKLEGLQKAEEAFAKAGGRVRDTGVEYPFHTPLMAEAQEKLREVLHTMIFYDALYPIIMNANGKVTMSGKEIKYRLPEQLTQPVDGVQVIERMKENGAIVIVEFCPRATLSGLVTRHDNNLRSMSVYDDKSLERLEEFLLAA